MPIFLLFHRAF